jgi:DNA-binding NarL/FixJ family response regulator
LNSKRNLPPLSPHAEEPLPSLLAEMAEVAGRDAAAKIASAVGGCRIYLPAHAEDDHWLVKAVGRQLADKLMRHFSIAGTRGARLDIPLPSASVHTQAQQSRSVRIRELSESGQSAREIARTLGIAERTVFSHRRRHREQAGTK